MALLLPADDFLKTISIQQNKPAVLSGFFHPDRSVQNSVVLKPFIHPYNA
jgi:hypothetical protein